ncbi:unnamed protein product [Jaminaea pallidilutea]
MAAAPKTALGTEPFWINTEDWHTAGEPFRIVSELPAGSLPDGPSVRERRQKIVSTPGHTLDQLRQILCHEPRGHADMYGGFVTPGDDEGAHFGVLFWHKDGFSTACGHGTIALGFWAVANGIVKAPADGTTDVVIDVPSGRCTARVTTKAGRPVAADFINVHSRQLVPKISVPVASLGKPLDVDLTFAGAMYATLDVRQLGNLDVVASNVNTFIALGREIKGEMLKGQLPYDLYGVIFYQETSPDFNGTVSQRNVTIFADGQVDRSPCGSGTCARLASLYAEGRIKSPSDRLNHGSIIGSQFVAGIVSTGDDPLTQKHGIFPMVSGRAGLCGKMQFYIDANADEVYPGFLLR